MIQINNQIDGFQIAKAIPRNYNPDCDIVISHRSSEGKLLGGVIFDGYTHNCIFIHQAGFDKRWLTGNMLWIAFDYPFNKLKVSKLAGTINSKNESLLAFNKKLGFTEECRIKDAYPDGDMIVMTMTREQCKWLKLKPRFPQIERAA